MRIYLSRASSPERGRPARNGLPIAAAGGTPALCARFVTFGTKESGIGLAPSAHMLVDLWVNSHLPLALYRRVLHFVRFATDSLPTAS